MKVVSRRHDTTFIDIHKGSCVGPHRYPYRYESCLMSFHEGLLGDPRGEGYAGKFWQNAFDALRELLGAAR